jgi:hypothetical protein
LLWRTFSDSSELIGITGRGLSGGFDLSADHPKESPVVRIAVVGLLVAILLGISGIMVLYVCLRLSFSSTSTLPESETEWLTDSQCKLRTAAQQ